MIKIAIDVETWQSKKFAFGIVLYETGEHHFFDNTEEMKNHLLSLVRKSKNCPDKYLIMGHNIAYDLGWIFGNPRLFFAPQWKNEGNKKRYNIDFLQRSGRFYKAKYYNLNFIDTLNIFPLSLEDAGKVVNHEKGKTPEKFLKNSFGEIDENDIKYCLDDCKICLKIFEYVEKWVLQKNGKIGLTVASSGLSILKSKNPDFKKWTELLIKNLTLRDYDESFRSSFFGGKTEVYKKKGENLNYYDVNSEYPYVMGPDFNYPDPATLKKIHCDISDLWKYLYKFEGCFFGKIEIPYSKYPLLPVRNRETGKIIYPYGTLTGAWNFPEIREALKLGGKILSIEKIIIGDRIKSPWAGYVRELYDERKKAKLENNPVEYVLKIFMNALYGKFAQRNFEDKLVKLSEDTENYSGEMEEIFGEYYFRIKTEPTRSNCDILSLASYVTTYARINLHRIIIKCGDVYYCDTDSVVTGKNLKTGVELGDLKKEFSIESASFIGRKDYLLKTKKKTILKRKGVPVKNLISFDNKILDEDDKKKLSEKDSGILELIHYSDVVKFSKISRFNEAIVRKMETSRYLEMDRERIKKYDDGRIWNGNDSEPIHVSDSFFSSSSGIE